MNEPRVLVFAYHDVGYECLELLLARRANVVAVYTHEDNPQERVWFKSVAELARSHGLPVHPPENVNTPEEIDRIRTLRPDLIFSFYYRNLITTRILDLPRLGAYNMHGSLLPKYRGRAPINWAVLHGEKETGATLHVMVKRPDAGDIVDQERVPIGPAETARDVFSKVAAAARAVLARQLDALLQGRAPRRAQDESQATYFGGRTAEDGRIDWNKDAREIFNLVRAVTHPYPGAFTELGDRRFYIWWGAPIPAGKVMAGTVIKAAPLTIACGNGAIEVAEWQWHEDRVPRRDADHGISLGTVLASAASAKTGVSA